MNFNESDFINSLFHANLKNFNESALSLFSFQLTQNEVFRRYHKSSNRNIDFLGEENLTYLPVELFKDHKVTCGNFDEEAIFTSSSTSGRGVSRHYVKFLRNYEMAFTHSFRNFYGDPDEYCILALLPSYLEREGSSLIYMTDKLIKLTGHPNSGFYLNEFDRLSTTLEKLKKQNQRTILLGVTFALLDFASQYSIDFKELIVMETGGMKGRRKEMVREEVHAYMSKSFQSSFIHSEYGMTETLSQAYALKDGKFMCPPWMKVNICDPSDPYELLDHGNNGIIQIIDLANTFSCAFIRTSDIGRTNADGSFEILGRTDHSETRGCSLLYL